MADVYGTQMTKVNSIPMKMGDAHSMGGRMRILSDTYTVPASGAAVWTAGRIWTCTIHYTID